jgi:hypothetical protein
METATLDIPIGAGLTCEQAEAIFAHGREAVVFALLEMAKRLAEAEGKTNPSTTPSTPSGMVPTYEKPTVKPRGKKRPGAKPGHAGSRRQKPPRIDRRAEHRAKSCPDCGGPLNRCAETRVRYVEDIPDIQPEVTEHTIHRDWCPKCHKKVEPPVTDALPGSQLGNRVLGERQNALAVVLLHAGSDVLHDRSVAGFAGAAEVFHRRIFRHPGERLLGRLQRGRLRAAANLPRAFAARIGADREVQIPRKKLAGVRQKTAAAAGGCDSTVAEEGSTDRARLRLAPRPADDALAAKITSDV